jgi:hypothetical protein
LNDLVEDTYQDNNVDATLAAAQEDWQNVAADEVDLPTRNAEPEEDCVLNVQWDTKNNWHNNPAYLEHILPNIANGGNLNSLQAAYNGLLGSAPPDLEADDTPLGFELNEQQKVGSDMIQMLIERDDNKCGIMLGKGGTGKTATIKAAKDVLVDVVGPAGFAYFAPARQQVTYHRAVCATAIGVGWAFPPKDNVWRLTERH